MKKKIGILALAAILVGGAIGANGLSFRSASAGWMETDPVTLSELSKKELDKTVWLFDDDGISIKDNKIVFAKDTFEEAKLLHRTQVVTDIEKSNYVIKATLGVKEMVGEKRFGIGFGFDRSRYIVGDINTNYFYVEKSGEGYVAGLCSYDEDGKKTELIAPLALQGTEWTFELMGAYPNTLTAKIGGSTVYEGETTAEDIDGYFGFLETGDTTKTQYSEEYVYDLTVSNDYYDTPENVNIYDDFEDGTLDTSVWSLYNSAGYLKGVAETDGMLRFIDSNESSVTTKYQYSNFELSMDIPYVKKKADFNSDGSLKTAACNWFGFFCGIQMDDYSGVTTATKIITDFPGTYFLTFRTQYDAKGDALGGTTVYFGPASGRTGYVLPAKYDLWDVANEDKTLNVVFTCLEGVYTLDIKWADETDYYHVFTVQYPLTTGYISLISYGLGDAFHTIKSNFAYDNVKITNRDYKGNVISGLYPESSDLIKETEDYGYADTKSPAQLIEDGTDFDDATNGCGGVLDVGMASVAILAGGMAVLTKRRSKK